MGPFVATPFQYTSVFATNIGGLPVCHVLRRRTADTVRGFQVKGIRKKLRRCDQFSHTILLLDQWTALRLTRPPTADSLAQDCASMRKAEPALAFPRVDRDGIPARPNLSGRCLGRSGGEPPTHSTPMNSRHQTTGGRSPPLKPQRPHSLQWTGTESNRRHMDFQSGPAVDS